MQVQSLILITLTSLAAAFLFYKFKNAKKDSHQIIEDIQKAYEQVQNHIIPLEPIKTYTLRDRVIAIQIMHVPSLKAKDALVSKQNLEKINYADPFLPPFPQGKLICQLPPKHRLLFNKCYFCPKHMLLVTKQFQLQTNNLDMRDWQRCLEIVRTLDGIFFFNCGEKADYSQKHKHIQILPHAGFQFPLIKILHDSVQSRQKIQRFNTNGSAQIYHYEEFNFLHGIFLIEEGEKDEEIHAKYLKTLRLLKNVLKVDIFSYNIIGCTSFVLIVPRRCQKIWENRIPLNSSIFLGIVMLKDEQLFSQFPNKYHSCSQILEEITYPSQFIHHDNK